MADKSGVKRSNSENDLKLNEPDKKRKTSADENENKNQQQSSLGRKSDVFDDAKEWLCSECKYLNRSENKSCEVCESITNDTELTKKMEELNSDVSPSNKSKLNLPCGIPDGESSESAGPCSTSSEINANVLKCPDIGDSLRKAANVVELLKSELDQYQRLIKNQKQIAQNNGETIPYPENWSGSINDKGLKLVPLDKEHPDYQFVIGTVGEALTPYLDSITSIQRVENWGLYHAFAQRRETMIKKNGTDVTNERWLWHGTNNTAIENILRFGFNRSYAGEKNDADLGYGVYFSPSLKTSLSYSDRETYVCDFESTNSNPGHRMLLCRVLTRNFTQGNSSLREPPLMANGDRYDSVCDDVASPNEYCVFQDHHAYPEYEITLNIPNTDEDCIIL